MPPWPGRSRPWPPANAGWSAAASGRWPGRKPCPRSWRTRRWATLKLDLRPGPEALREGFKPAARKAIARAERDGITVRRIESLEELERYYRFAEDCSRRYGKRLYGFRDFSTIWELIRPVGVFETFAAEHRGETIAGLSVWGCGKSIGELGSFQSERSFREKLYGPDLVKWELIRWACAAGLESYDLAGINPQPASEKESGIRRFKEKWGGAWEEYLLVRP